MSTVNNNIKNAAQCVIDWVLGKGYTNVSCAESIADSQISQHSGVDCTGTLVPSDLTSINNSISNLNTCTASLGTAVNNLCSCSGLNCVGTVVASDLTPITNRLTTLESCPGLQCTGTSTARFSLSGTTLTITV